MVWFGDLIFEFVVDLYDVYFFDGMWDGDRNFYILYKVVSIVIFNIGMYIVVCFVGV